MDPEMDTSETRVPLQGAVKIFEAGLTAGNKTIWMFGSFGLCIEYIF